MGRVRVRNAVWERGRKDIEGAAFDDSFAGTAGGIDGVGGGRLVEKTDQLPSSDPDGGGGRCILSCHRRSEGLDGDTAISAWGYHSAFGMAYKGKYWLWRCPCAFMYGMFSADSTNSEFMYVRFDHVRYLGTVFITGQKEKSKNTDSVCAFSAGSVWDCDLINVRGCSG